MARLRCIQRLGLPVFANALVQIRQIIQGGSGIGVIGAEGFFIDG